MVFRYTGEAAKMRPLRAELYHFELERCQRTLALRNIALKPLLLSHREKAYNRLSALSKS